jgi:chorismate synthase
MPLHYQTAGESHGPALVTTITGLPAGVPIDADFINAELRRRQGGYGRGGRQRIETDAIEILTGVRRGVSIGSPITFRIPNKDSRLDDLARTPPVHTPRPGHADLAGSVKYLTTDCRETLERASARETAARVAAGAAVRAMLKVMGIEVFGFVRSIHAAHSTVEITEGNWRSLLATREASDTYCPDLEATKRQEEAIHKAKVDKTTVGGIVEAHAFGCPPGLGSTMDWRDKLDARLAYALMGIQAIKGVEVGLGFACAERFGHEVHDPIRFDASKIETPTLGFVRDSNNAGGTEGGMTNGAPVVVRAAMKPISTLLRGMPSVKLNTKAAATSDYERSDICAVSAASVVVENAVAFEIARVALEKFGGDSLPEVLDHQQRYMRFARMLPLNEPTATIAGTTGGPRPA